MADISSMRFDAYLSDIGCQLVTCMLRVLYHNRTGTIACMNSTICITMGEDVSKRNSSVPDIKLYNICTSKHAMFVGWPHHMPSLIIGTKHPSDHASAQYASHETNTSRCMLASCFCTAFPATPPAVSTCFACPSTALRSGSDIGLLHSTLY